VLKTAANSIVVVLVLASYLAGRFGLFTSWGMSPPAAVALVILLIAATLWISEAVPLFVTSFVVLAFCLIWLVKVLQAHGIDATAAQFTSPFFSNIILLFLGGFVISSALHKHCLDECAARWVIRRTGSSIPKLIAGLMAITALLSMFLSNTATTAMMIALCLPIIQTLPAADRRRKAILLAIPFSANVGGLATPIGTPPNAIAMDYLDELGQAIGFGTWMIMALPLVLIMLLIIWGTLLLMYRGDARTIEAPPAHGPGDLPSADRGVVIAVALLTVIGWLTTRLHGLSLGTISIIPIIVFFGLRILDIGDFRALSWDVLVVMGGGLCLGTAMSTSGLAEWIIAQLPSGGLGLAMLMVIFGGVACLMSSLMSNTAAANLILAIVVGLQLEGLASIVVSVAFCCSMAMALPISTPPNAMAFSSGELTVKDMLAAGLPFTIIGVVLTFTVGIWWWGVVGSF
jgi:sodium-dependent dicarboxylate transporter 2/3/5